MYYDNNIPTYLIYKKTLMFCNPPVLGGDNISGDSG